MAYEDMVDNMKATASHYADPEEYEQLNNVSKLHRLLSTKFYALPKYEKAKAKGNCRKCFGRGYLVKAGGGRLVGCTCLRIKKEEKK
jgi:hypothetical protein